MRFVKFGTLVAYMLVFTSASLAQKRAPQWEAFIGAAIPTAPEGIEDAVKVGLSLHFQYVTFLSPRFGLSLGLALEGFTSSDDVERLGLDVDVDGQLNVGELGIGLRPYLTSTESNLQIYLFGMGTFSTLQFTIPDSEGGEAADTVYKPGLALGGGIEIPAGSRVNLLFQVLGRVIFTDTSDTGEPDHFQFIGVTGGVAF